MREWVRGGGGSGLWKEECARIACRKHQDLWTAACSVMVCDPGTCVSSPKMKDCGTRQVGVMVCVLCRHAETSDIIFAQRDS